MKPPKIAAVLLSFVFLIQHNCLAVIDHAKLAEEIYQALKSDYPDDKVQSFKWMFAKLASAHADDDVSLNKNLIQIFSGGDPDLAWLDWPNKKGKLRLIAQTITYAEFPDKAAGVSAGNSPPVMVKTETAMVPPPEESSEKEIMLQPNGLALPLTLIVSPDTNIIYGDVSFWTGARFSNPYVINGNALTNAGKSSDGYIELNLSRRFILSKNFDPVWKHLGTPRTTNGFMNLVNPIAHFPDIDTRIGYLFRGGSAPTNYNSATVVGSADFYADTSIGLPVWRYISKDNVIRSQVTLELGGGFATDKDHLDLHPTAFVGAGWQFSYQLGTNRLGYWVGRAGYSFIDQPSFTGTGNLVNTNRLGEPVFNFKGAPTMGVIAVYPINDVLNLQAQANAYFTSRQPATWNISLGLSLNLDTFFPHK